MLTAMRAQVQAVLYAVPVKRKPALRRSDLADALLATDLPLVAEESAVEAFRAQMHQCGWRTGFHNGWLTLDGPVSVPEAVIPDVLTGECGCCISLLLRHAEDAPAEEFIRTVVKAADVGRQPFERLCADLHGEFAARLRKHTPLPGTLLPFLCHAYHKLNQ